MGRTKGAKNGQHKEIISIRLDESVLKTVESMASLEEITPTQLLRLVVTKHFTNKSVTKLLKKDAKLERDNAIANSVKEKLHKMKNIASVELTRALLPANVMIPIFKSLLLTHTVDERFIRSQRTAYERMAKTLKSSKKDQERMHHIFLFLSDTQGRRQFIEYYEKTLRNKHDELVKMHKDDEAFAVLSRKTQEFMIGVLTHEEKKRLGLITEKGSNENSVITSKDDAKNAPPC